MKAYLNKNNPKRNTLIVRGTRKEMEVLLSLLDTGVIVKVAKRLMGVDLEPFGVLTYKHASSMFCATRRNEWSESIRQFCKTGRA